MAAHTTIALIHGLGGSRRSWAPVLPLLEARGLRPVPCELPGYGAHRGKRPERTIEGMAEALVPQLEALGDDLVVAGHSMGGLVATALAETRPRWLRRIAVVNSSLTVASRLTAHRGSEGLIRRPVVGRIAWRIAPRAKLRAGLCSAFAPGFAVPDQFVDDLRACSWATFTRSSAALDRYLAEQPLVDRIAALPVPATLIYGTRDLRLDRACVEAIREALPEPIVEIEDSGHTPMWESPEATAGALAAAVLTPAHAPA